MSEGNLSLQVSKLGSAWISPFEKHRDVVDRVNLMNVRSLC
jgi:hypothetical protein